MNSATFISFGAAILQLGFGTMFLLISRAHGWSRGRLFAVIAYSAAAYSLVDITFTLPIDFDEVGRMLGPLNYLVGAVHCSAWLVYAYGNPDHPWRDLPRSIRVAVAITLGLGVVSVIPGAITAPGIMTLDVPWLHAHYRQANTNAFAGLVGAWFMVALGIVFARFVAHARRGLEGAAVQIAGFSVFFACAIVEILVTNGVIRFPYLADIGFLAVVMVVLTETIRRVLADARTLAALGQDLARQVEHRTRERDVANEALTHAERLAAVGQLAAGVGHEINNPLTVVQVNLELLHDDAIQGRGPDATLVTEALDGVHRISRVVADLRTYALPESEHRELVTLASVVRSARKLASHRLRHVASVEEDLAELAPVRVDAVRLSQVFVNLLVNAGQALEEARHAEPRIVIRGRMRGDDRAAIEVVDNGVGIPADALARLSEPYFSSRHSRGGTGLGLFVARNLVTSFDGVLEFESQVGRGTTARVILPTVGDAPSVRTPSEITPLPVALPVPPPARRRALIIDDEPLIVRSVSRQLASFEVTTCVDPQQALTLLESPAPFDVILCDLMMPGLSGAELHGALSLSRPDRLPRMLFMTGGAVTASAESFLADPLVRHLLKPFTRADLVRALEDVLMTQPS